MFKKPFRVKSNTPIKSSERKHLKELLTKRFPFLTEADVENILPKKETASCMKIITADNVTVQVYLVQKRAIAFEHNSLIYPTVYLLWKYSDLAVCFTTTSFVVTKISGGADLMLPGVILNPHGYGAFPQNELASVNTTDNKACIAVGVTTMSSSNIVATGGKGKCVHIYHFYGDHLCTVEDMPVQILPQLGPPEWLKVDDDFPPLNAEHDEEPENGTQEIDDNQENTAEPSTSLNETEEMDKLLINSFLTAVKYSKTLELPMLTSLFYKLEVMSVCPSDRTLDIKKSSFKKVGQFLKHMCKEGVIDIKEKKKGVETLESINRGHPMLKGFYVEVQNRPKAHSTKTETQEESTSRNIVETFAVTAAVEPLFREYNLKKGDTLTKQEIKKHTVDFVKSHNYQEEENKRFVKVGEGPLSSICKNEAVVTWEELMDKVCSAMKPCFKVTTATEEMVSKGKLEPIVMTVHKRGGNKKVTLIDNLELYGIRISEFAKQCQHGVAASTSISKPPGKKCEELLVQGNQILFVYSLLVDKYKIPKKYIRGLENAPKKK